MFDSTILSTRTIREEMIVNHLNNGASFPINESRDRAEQDIRQNGVATMTALTVELKDGLEVELETITQFQNQVFRIKKIVEESKRQMNEEKEDFIDRAESLFERHRVNLNEIRAMTTGDGKNPRTVKLRQEAAKKSVWHGAGDGILSTIIIAGSGALEGGWLNSANYGLITPITATLLGYCAGDWLIPIAKEVRQKPVIGGLAWLVIITMGLFVYILVNQFADFRETLEAVPADYVSMALQAINLFAFFATLIVWSKAPPAAPKLKLLKKEIAQRADEVLDLYESAEDEVKDVSDESIDDLDDLIEDLEDEVSEVTISFERVQEDYRTYLDDIDAARADHEKEINKHRAQIRESVDASTTLPEYINTDADLSEVFVSGFDPKRYETLTDNARKTLTTLDADVEIARQEIDEMRAQTLTALKDQRQKDPTF